MGMHIDRFKCVVAALFLSSGISLPALAQETDLDELHQQLSEADAVEAERLAGQIISTWERSGSPAMDLLLRRGKEALEQGQPDIAVEHFSALVDHAPYFTEGYFGRASSYYLLGMTGPALEDIQTVLRLNPLHFEAMTGLAIVLEELGRSQDALELYRMILDIHPHSAPALEATSRLELELEGQAL
ncbi:tetratricopeptide repeat protein [Yoonia litorea]|uniref:Tetratricopeptide repeat-containing protein n=1 Tax=Yoonia litorea TaxID=1123755 RepID=A0A1I6LMC3_9RHOB|nr:tetratricopeptide repeat protein [Yoonia litorea]SFS04440.1 Tetratricopeptide repeat-containing protein [Yoonia litorea]